MAGSLFLKELPQCTTDEELRELQAKNPSLDTYYLASSVIPERRALFEGCYKLYEPYGDTNFLIEIPTRFHQRTWEMYLGALCIKNRKVLKKDRGDDQADLQIVSNQLIHIECTAVTHGDPKNANTVPKMHISNIENIIVQEVPEEKILLRITQALNDKRKQYQERITDRRILANEPYIIAINTGEMGYPEHLPRILKAVFGIGYLNLRMRQDGLPIANPPSFWSRRESIPKANNEGIDMTFFEKEENKGISAVIYSRSVVLHHLADTSLEPILVHNPLANNPINFDEFNFLEQYYVDRDTGDVVKKPVKII